ncbi:MAG: hypothetical protein FRX49_11890 [Trebouxia sp. A1-2]|nr:MAG: hypothetical protein FRX49_11890 [Trebouxia sp. A1-2]
MERGGSSQPHQISALIPRVIRTLQTKRSVSVNLANLRNQGAQGMHHSVGDALCCRERHLDGFGDLLIPSWTQSSNLGAALSPFGMLLAAVGAPDEHQKLGGDHVGQKKKTVEQKNPCNGDGKSAPDPEHTRMSKKKSIDQPGREQRREGREQGRVGHTSSELVDGNGILDVLQGQCPVAPNNPWMNESCRHNQDMLQARASQKNI